VERGICPIAESMVIDNVIFQCACVKLLHFYFRSEIWWSEQSRWSTCVIVLNFMVIGQTITEIWWFFDFSRWWPPHLRILNFGSFNSRNNQDGQTVSLCQISWRLVKVLRRYGDFSISQDGSRHHLGFLNFWNFNGRERSKGPNCANVPNFVTIG